MKVKFLPQNVELEIKPGQSVMNLAHESGLPIHSSCNGIPSCSECRVRVVEGEWNLNPPSRKELNLIGTGYFIDQRRLACQMLCFGDVTVDLSEQLEKAAEGPVTKKFLSKVHKTSIEDTHSLGGVLIEQDQEFLTTLKSELGNVGLEVASDSLEAAPRRQNEGRQDHHQNRSNNGGGGHSRRRRNRNRSGRK